MAGQGRNGRAGGLVGFKLSSELSETEAAKTEFGTFPLHFRMVRCISGMFKSIQSAIQVMAACPWRTAHSDEGALLVGEGSTRPNQGPDALVTAQPLLFLIKSNWSIWNSNFLSHLVPQQLPKQPQRLRDFTTHKMGTPVRFI